MKKKIIYLFIIVFFVLSQLSIFSAETQGNEIKNKTLNKGIIYGNPSSCTIGVSTIKDCFTDLVWANAVAKKVGTSKLGTWIPEGYVTAIPQYDVDVILTDTLISKITTIDGISDVQPFIYKDTSGTSYMPKMDGLGLFTQLKTMRNFKSGTSSDFASIAWTDAGVTDFGKWGEAPNLESITDIRFSNGTLTSIDVGSWGNLSQLKTIQNVNFSRNKLTSIGDLGNWKNATNLEKISYISFERNQLTNVGKLSEWKHLSNLKIIESMVIQNNQLTDIGDLGEWEILPQITKISSLWFGNNKLTNIGDLGKWKSLSTLTSLTGVSFHTNNLTNIGDLGEWSNLTNLTQFSHINFDSNRLTNIGDLGRWSSLSKITRLEYISFERNLLFDIGDLGEWSKLTNLTSLGNIDFYYNRLSTIGNIGRWSELNKLTNLSYINFGLNSLTDIGDLGEWSKLTNLERLTSITFSSNHINSIGDISKWSELAKLKNLYSINFRYNRLTNIGDLSKWSELTELVEFGSFDFALNYLTNIGDIGEWSKLTKITEIKYIDFSGNTLTDIGDLGRWANIPNLTNIYSINFSGNRLTNIGDLGKWGTHSKLLRIWELNFSNNQLTTIGDLGKWGNLSTLATLRTLNFSSNNLTDIGDLQQWQNIPNVASFVREINFSKNNLETVSLTNTFASQTFPTYSSLFNFQAQKYQKNSFYINRHGLADGDRYNLNVPAQNAFNYPSGEYGSYTLTPDINEIYLDSQNNVLSVLDNNLTLPVKVKDANATYTIAQKNHIPVDYTATITHLLYWIDLDVDATDFEIELSDISANLVNDQNAISYANAVITLIDENNQMQTVTAVVNQDEYQAIKDTMTTGVFPLTFSYTYQNITVEQTIQVTVKDTPIPDVLTINANDFEYELSEVGTLTENLSKNEANVQAKNVTQNTNITSQVTVDSVELTAIQSATTTGIYPLTFTVTDNGQSATTTINVTVKDTPAPDVLAIDATDFEYELSEVGTLTESLSKSEANVQAKNVMQNTDITDHVTVDSAELTVIQSATTTGIYPLTFTVTDNGQSATTTINVTLKDTPVPDVLAIDATDFEYELSEVGTLTESLSKSEANVQAKNVMQNTDITNQVTVDLTELTAIQSATIIGTYPLTFNVTDNGQSARTTINVTLKDTLVPDVLTIDATDFSMNLKDASALTESQSIINASVQAMNITEHRDITNKVTVNLIELATIQEATTVGMYPLTFRVTDNGEMVEITINVTLENPENPDVLSIDATDFSIKLADVSALTENQSIIKANTQALNVTQNKNITNQVTVNQEELLAIQTATTIGTYPLTFNVTDNGRSTTTTINVTIYNTNDVYVISANDASLKISDYWNLKNNGMLEQHIIDITNAKAFNETLKVEVNPIITDLTNFETTPIVNGAQVKVVFSYLDANQENSVKVNNNQEISTSVTITLYEDDNNSNNLVSTGTYSLEILLNGILLLAISAMVLSYTLSKNKKRKTLHEDKNEFIH